jgi:hypothetical protein
LSERQALARHLLLWLDRECSSEGAANSAAKLHPQLGPLDVKHDPRVDSLEGFGGGQQLPLT